MSFSSARGGSVPPVYMGPKEPLSDRLQRWLWGFLTLLVLLLLLILFLGPNIYTEWLWFDDLGFASVYVTRLVTQAALFLTFAIAFFLILFLNLALAQRLSPREGPEFVPEQELLRDDRLMGFLLLGGSIFLALIMGGAATSQWETVLRFQNATSFDLRDPILGQDVGFYVFTLPLYRFLQSWAIGGMFLILIAVGLLYLFNYSLFRFERGLTPAIKGHLSALGAVILFLFAWGYLLDIYELLYSTRGAAFGASFTDANAQWGALQLLSAIAALCALLLLVNIFLRGLWLPTLGLGIWFLASIIVGDIYPALVQRFQVEPNELAKEKPYIDYNIQMTRQAFALDRIEERPFPAETEVSIQDIDRNRETVNNIRLWDHRPLKDTYNQIQSIRLYYEFRDVDIDRYWIGGRYRQVMLAARELNPERLAAQAQTWVNQRLQFTHGYGIALSPVNEITTEGLPRLLVKDVPPLGEIKVERPEIYFGEGTRNYVIVDTEIPEFDYPKGDTNVYSSYKGERGVKLDSSLKRLAFALRFGDYNILLTQYLKSESRILYHRLIQERVRLIAPFLVLDRDPYLVVADGGLFWIQDAYTTTDRYPYSEPYQKKFNYIRNSVKVVINASDGTTRFYLADEKDPIILTYGRIFPVLLTPLSEMPQSLRGHLRYPEDLFQVQAQKYLTYHMQEAQVFYNREDLYNIPLERFGEAQQPVEPYYVIMRLPGEAREEFLIMLPFTPAGGKDNTIAWLAARSDGEQYGRLLAYKFPKDKLIYGPLQVESRIDQDPTISAQLTLWNQGGSRVIRGNTLMIPIERSYLYVEPIYLQAEKSQIPELKRVVVSNGDRLAMEPTLEDSLARVVGAAVSPPRPATPVDRAQPAADIASLARSVQDHYQKAQERLKAGDWSGYGEELKQMQAALERLIDMTSR